MRQLKIYVKELGVRLINDYLQIKLKQIEADKLQLKAYNSEGNTVVLAGPGSGKTTVLTMKVIRLLSESIHTPRGLACLTYSREAAREFQERLKLMGLKKRKNVFLGTVHSFCLKEILIPFSRLYPKYNIPNPIKIISASEKNKLFKEIKDSLGFEDLKIEEMDKERTRDITGYSKINIPSYDVALKTAIAFEDRLLQEGYIDYTSMVKSATILIQNEEYVRKSLEAKFPCLVIDEYQDLGKPLHEMVLGLLSNTKIKLFAVGDPDQSIYDFQGASPEYLIELSKWEGIDSYIRFINNYRSALEIIDGSEIVLGQKRNYIPKGELKDYKASIDFYVCEEGMNEQFIKVVDVIEECKLAGIPYHEIAILAGYQNQLKELSQICISKNIPYYMAKHDFDRSDFVKWLEDCATWTINNIETSFDDIYQYWEYILNAHEISIIYNERIFYKRQLFDVLNNSSEYNDSLLEWLNFILESLHIDELLKGSEMYPDELANLDKLKRMLSEEPYNKYTLEKFTQLGSPKNQVVLSTRHGSKGLEFDVVIMVGMEQDSFPRYKSTKEELEEANRICFVSVSRARKKCILLRSKYLNIPTRSGDIWCKPCEPSPFWNMLYAQQKGKAILITN